jgi:hypothetical protein
MATFSTEATISVKVTRTPLSFLEHEVFFTDQLGAYHAVFLGLLFSVNLILSLSKITVTTSDTLEQASKPLKNNIKGGKEQK